MHGSPQSPIHGSSRCPMHGSPQSPIHGSSRCPMNGSPKGAMIGHLHAPACYSAFSHPKAFSSLAFIRYPSPLHSAFLPTQLKGGKHQSLLYSPTGGRFPTPLPSRSRNDRGATLLPVGRMGSPSRGEEDTPSLALGSPHRSSSGKRLQLAPVAIDANIPQELIIAQDRIHGLPAKMIRDAYAP